MYQDDLEIKNEEKLTEEGLMGERENIENLIIDSKDPKSIVGGMNKILELRAQKKQHKERESLPFFDDDEEKKLIQEGINELINSGDDTFILEGLKKFNNFCSERLIEAGIEKLLNSDNIEIIKASAKMMSNRKNAEINRLKVELHSSQAEVVSLNKDMEAIREIRGKL